MITTLEAKQRKWSYSTPQRHRFLTLTSDCQVSFEDLWLVRIIRLPLSLNQTGQVELDKHVNEVY